MRRHLYKSFKLNLSGIENFVDDGVQSRGVIVHLAVGNRVLDVRKLRRQGGTRSADSHVDKSSTEQKIANEPSLNDMGHPFLIQFFI
jgi:hypothetical protein